MAEPVLEVNIPYYAREGFTLSNISFEVQKGFVTGIFGLNGAGKTTLLKLLSTGIGLDENMKVNVCGMPMQSRETEAKDKIGFVFDENPFWAGSSAEQCGEIMGNFYTCYDRRRYWDYLERFEIPKKKRIKSLSKGMGMKVQLAFALSHQAELLIMDEPTASLDPVFREEFSLLLADIVKEGNCGVLLSSQLISEQEKQTDFCLLIHEGKNLYYGSVEELMDAFRIVRGKKELFPYFKSKIIGTKEGEFTSEALIYRPDDSFRFDVTTELAHIDQLLYYIKTGALTKEVFSNVCKC